MNKFIIKGKIITDLIPNEGIDCQEELEDIDTLNRGQQKANEKTAPELAKLVVYSRATKLKSFSSAAKYSSFDMCSSINSPTAQKHAEKDSAAFVKHTNFQLIRIYPHAVNQLSQNYDPILPWSQGCQIVALNYQTQVSYRNRKLLSNYCLGRTNVTE